MAFIFQRTDSYAIDHSFSLNYLLKPSSHNDMMCCKALEVLRLVINLIKEFIQNNSVKTMYYALVKQILELNH